MSLLLVYLDSIITGDVIAYLIGLCDRAQRTGLARRPRNALFVSVGRLGVCRSLHAAEGRTR
jgi:hypothetical protein